MNKSKGDPSSLIKCLALGHGTNILTGDVLLNRKSIAAPSHLRSPDNNINLGTHKITFTFYGLPRRNNLPLVLMLDVHDVEALPTPRYSC